MSRSVFQSVACKVVKLKVWFMMFNFEKRIIVLKYMQLQLLTMLVIHGFVINFVNSRTHLCALKQLAFETVILARVVVDLAFDSLL